MPIDWAESFAAETASFWRPRSLARPVTQRLAPGAYAVELHATAPLYATLRLEFEDGELAPIEVSLDPFEANAYRKLFSIRSATRALTLCLEPAVDEPAVRAFRIDRLGTAQLAARGMKKVLASLSAPGLLARKARQVLSGAGNLVFSPVDDARSPSESYRAWRAAFESAAERARVLAALEPWRGRKELAALAVIPAGLGTGELIETCKSLSRSAGQCTVHYALVGDSGEAELAALGVRASEFKDSESEVSLSAIFDHAAAVTAGTILFIDTPGRFHELALASLLLELAENPDAAAAYADSDRLIGGGARMDPDFKPAWSPDFLRGADYIGAPVVFRADPELLGAADLALSARPSYELLLRLAGRTPPASVRHVPRVLFHRRGAASKAREIHRPHLTLPAPPLASVIIPSKDNAALLARAVSSVQQSGYPRVEIVIVDNGSSSPAQRALIDKLAHEDNVRIVSDPQPFNFSRLINAGRRVATGDVLLLLNDDVETTDVTGPGWLSELVSQAMRPGIGCVGALLLYPDHRIQHAGVILGINSGPAHAFHHTPIAEAAADPRLRLVHEVSAVTGACLAVRTALFDAAGGLDEALPVTLNDVDFCLRVAALGHRNIVTPHATLIHRESSTRGLDMTRDKLDRLQRETGLFLRKWGERAAEDPYINPHLSRSHDDYRPRQL
jgi:GT2 family glycosyltransferase